MTCPMKEHEVNRITSFFHLAAFLITCTAMAQSGWFRVRGMQCVPHLGLGPFFGFGEFSTQPVPPSQIQRHLHNGEIDQVMDPPITVSYMYIASDTLACVSPRLVNLMKIIILLCFMVIIFSLLGIFLNVSNFKNEHVKILQRNGVLSIFTFLWVMAIIGVSFYVTVVIEEENSVGNKIKNVSVSYEYGFYTIVAAGAISVFGAATSLLLANNVDTTTISRRPLIDDWDGLESFNIEPSPRVRPAARHTVASTYTPFVPTGPRRARSVQGVCESTRPESPPDVMISGTNLAMMPPPPPYTP